MKIKIETEVNAPLTTVWDAWVTPEDITNWNFAADAWCCPKAELDLKVGGTFKYRMEAKDGSMGFDFEGTFTKIDSHESIQYVLEDKRVVTVEFTETPSGVRVVETFDAEEENSAELQERGWQSILNNFKKHVERKGRSE
ncbi:ATPase [Aliidiomarina halalkaliphila]|uniref:ATPase n=1 Tax=Aliidiomarina halalkaliphila TaxID=2593535 RepID=A0A552X5P1_9GAMM|nr:SRPBCC family protein [Aliidiomarina halalkaliphila]TRW49903.1 ATPase [Aliidiomarina halalkaliphila]